MNIKPPEYRVLLKEHETIVEETIAKLKQELGEESFTNLDAWINRHWAGGKIIGGPSSASNSSVPLGVHP
jgi:hypothetical protein